jgi:hypothetical protein
MNEYNFSVGDVEFFIELDNNFFAIWQKNTQNFCYNVQFSSQKEMFGFFKFLHEILAQSKRTRIKPGSIFSKSHEYHYVGKWNKPTFINVEISKSADHSYHNLLCTFDIVDGESGIAIAFTSKEHFDELLDKIEHFLTFAQLKVPATSEKNKLNLLKVYDWYDLPDDIRDEANFEFSNDSYNPYWVKNDSDPINVWLLMRGAELGEKILFSVSW